MSDDQQQPNAPRPHTGWGGEAESEATAFIQMPPGGYAADVTADPLAAPGQGFRPPEIGEAAGPPATPSATTDPGAAGQWSMPFAGVRTADPEPAYREPQPPAAAMGQGAAAALAGSHQGRSSRRPPGAAADLPPGADAGLAGAEGTPYRPATSADVPPREPRAGVDPSLSPAAPPSESAGFPVGAGVEAPVPARAPGGETAVPSAGGSADSVPELPEAATPATVPASARPSEHPETSYFLRVNGTDQHVSGAWIGESLLYVLRERLGLAGAKDGCSQGECGACSVQVEGRLVAACLVPAATAAGCEIRTVEGLGKDGEPSDVQRALAGTGVQCGFCLPGMAMTVHDLLQGNHAPTELEARRALCGNLCRCTGYRGVLNAVRTVSEERAAAAEVTRRPAQEATGRIPQQATDDRRGQAGDGA